MIDAQQAIVTLAALGAGAVVVRRVAAAWRPKKAACPSCASGERCAPAATADSPTVHPLVLVKTKSRS